MSWESGQWSPPPVWPLALKAGARWLIRHNQLGFPLQHETSTLRASWGKDSRGPALLASCALNRACILYGRRRSGLSGTSSRKRATVTRSWRRREMLVLNPYAVNDDPSLWTRGTGSLVCSAPPSRVVLLPTGGGGVGGSELCSSATDFHCSYRVPSLFLHSTHTSVSIQPIPQGIGDSYRNDWFQGWTREKV